MRVVLPASISATSLTLDTPAQTTPNTAIIVTGTYGGSPTALDYNFGAGWVQASSPTFAGGTFSFTIPAGLAAGTYTPQIRDHATPSVSDSAGNFVVSAWTPETLTNSPGAQAVFEFNANNPTMAAVSADGSVHGVVNGVNSSQSLTAEVGTAGNGIVIANGSGADGARRLLDFHATRISANNYDPSTQWLSAGGVNGSAGSTLVNLANSSNLSRSGAFTTIIALDIDKSYTYEAGQIWGALAKPGPLQYAQLRINFGSGVQGANITDSNLGGASAKGSVTAGWHVMTMVKDAGTLTYRLDGKLVQTSSITSTDSFTARDFMIGGGLPAASSSSAGAENGVPPPYVGEFQAYSGVLSGTDLANAEKLAGNAIGLSLNPGVPTPPPGATVSLSAPGTVQEAYAGAGVTVNESVTTTSLSGPVYEEVLTSSGVVETSYQAVALGANGAATFSAHLAHSGDTIRVVDNTAAPTVTANSSPVTITDPAPAAAFAATLPRPLYTGIQTVTGTGGVAGLQLERITQGSYNTPGQSGWVAATVAADGTWSVRLTFDKPRMLAHVFAENGGSRTIVDLVNGTPIAPPATASRLAFAFAPPSLGQAVADVTGSQNTLAKDFATMSGGTASGASLAQPQTSPGGMAASMLHDLAAGSARIVLPLHQNHSSSA